MTSTTTNPCTFKDCAVHECSYCGRVRRHQDRMPVCDCTDLVAEDGSDDVLTAATGYAVTRTTGRDGVQTAQVTEGFDTSSEALVVLMNEARDLTDKGFRHVVTNGTFPGSTGSRWEKGRVTVDLTFRPVVRS